MKKIVFTGIILVLVIMFAVTCEESPAGNEVEYTDVEYSPDGKQITLYLDGVGAPVTPAQRAVNVELAKMAYDYFEVVFQSSQASTATPADTGIARAKWELGERAGIYDVPRNTGSGTTNINYGFSSTTAAAAMCVGKKADKTLLGIGYLTNVDHANTATTVVTATSTSVTFSIAAIKTALILPSEETYQDVPISDNSFVFTTPADATYSRASVNGSPLQYPKYTLADANRPSAAIPGSPSVPATTAIGATYTFNYIGTNDVFTLVKMLNTAPYVPSVQKRVPRFMSGGRYMEPKDGWTTVTKVNFTTGWLAGITGGQTAFSGKKGVNLEFTTKKGGTGVFSFYIEIPVCNLNNVGGTYGSVTAVPAEAWFIRTGVGSEFYSLDDGVANGGCVFIQVGDSSSANWIDIDWVWL